MRAHSLILICIVCCLSSAAGAVSADETKVLALEKKWTDAYKQHNISSVTALLAEDFTITVEDGRVFGKMGYIAHTADASVQVDLAEQSDLKVHVRGNLAVVTGAYRELGSSSGKHYEYRDRFTDVWIRSDAGWQLIASHYGVPVQQ